MYQEMNGFRFLYSDIFIYELIVTYPKFNLRIKGHVILYYVIMCH